MHGILSIFVDTIKLDIFLTQGSFDIQKDYWTPRSIKGWGKYTSFKNLSFQGPQKISYGGLEASSPVQVKTCSKMCRFELQNLNCKIWEAKFKSKTWKVKILWAKFYQEHLSSNMWADALRVVHVLTLITLLQILSVTVTSINYTCIKNIKLQKYWAVSILHQCGMGWSLVGWGWS